MTDRNSFSEHCFLFLNINILILHYVSMQSEIDSPVSFELLSKINSLKQYISELEAENNIIKAENVELKARIAKLEDKLTQNELIKNLLSVSRKT
jgi:cell division protein FtsB